MGNFELACVAFVIVMIMPEVASIIAAATRVDSSRKGK